MYELLTIHNTKSFKIATIPAHSTYAIHWETSFPHACRSKF